MPLESKEMIFSGRERCDMMIRVSAAKALRGNAALSVLNVRERAAHYAEPSAQ